MEELVQMALEIFLDINSLPQATFFSWWCDDEGLSCNNDGQQGERSAYYTGGHG
jgi:hypothetical protein